MRQADVRSCLEDALYNVARALDIARIRGWDDDVERLSKRQGRIQASFDSRFKKKASDGTMTMLFRVVLCAALAAMPAAAAARPANPFVDQGACPFGVLHLPRLDDHQAHHAARQAKRHDQNRDDRRRRHRSRHHRRGFIPGRFACLPRMLMTEARSKAVHVLRPAFRRRRLLGGLVQEQGL